MANNLRTFYACQALAVAPLIPDSNGNYNASGTAPFTGLDVSKYNFIHGVQSVGLNTSFDFENIFELGQLEIYDAVLNIPEIEITVEKVLDGWKTVYGILSSGTPLETASKRRANVRFALYGDEGNAGSTITGMPSGNLLGIVECTGMYINNVTYTFPVDGNCTESITFVGNHKQWYPVSGTMDNGLATGWNGVSGISIPSTITNGSGVPDDVPAYSRLIRREDVVVTSPGSTKAQNVTLTLNLGREDVFEFGKRIPYAKIATYPVEATAEIESLAVDGSYDDVSFTEDTSALPVKDRAISVVAGNTYGSGLTINLGNRNFLTAISHTGGDATGGNATVSRSFTTYNTFTVTDSGRLV